MANFLRYWTPNPMAHACLSVGQPYAQRIVLGTKPVENRGWPTDYVGPLLIHAGVGRRWLSADDPEDHEKLPFGAVVGQVDLVACVRAEELYRLYPWAITRGDGDHAGPWCWVLKNPRRLRRPIPFRGELGLFGVPHSLFTNPC